MADYTVSVEQPTPNTVSVQDIVNAVSVSEVGSNNVTVVAATFINDSGASSNLFYSTGEPVDSLGEEGDFYIDTSLGKLWGPRGVTSWSTDPLPLIPKRHMHTQNVASSVWSVVHQLDGFPSVTVVDSAGSVVVGEVSYSSASSLTISFQGAFTGKAYLT